MQLPGKALTTTLGGIGACAAVAIAVTVIVDRTALSAGAGDPARSTLVTSLAPGTAHRADPIGVLRLRGRAIDLDHEPVAGATIWLDHARMTRSAGDGWFGFDHVAPGIHALTAEDGERYGELPTVPFDAIAGPAEIVLSAGPTIVLQLVEPDGSPVAGARAATLPNHSAVSDSDGVVRLRGRTTGLDAVNVTAPLHASVTVMIDTDDPRAVVHRTVTLEPGAWVGGTVLDPDGHPAPNATVWIDTEAGTWRDLVVTDDSGAWQIGDIGPGKHAVYATAWGRADAPDVAFEHSGVRARAGLVLRLGRATLIEGDVIDAAGAPVAQASVNIAGAGSYDRFATADAFGRFAVGEPPGRAYEIYANTPTGVSRVVTIAPGDAGPHRLTMMPSSIAGTVVDTAGVPVDGAAISARGERDHYRAQTDAHGRFDLGGVIPGLYEITVEHGAHTHDPLPSLITTAGDRGVALVVPRLAAITGRVVAGGAPVPAFGVAISSATEAAEDARPLVVRNPDGRFMVRGLDAGRDRVTIVAPGFASRTIEAVELAAGATTDLGDLALGRGRAISGRVADESGVPVAGAAVTVYVTRPRMPSDDGWRDMLVGARTVRTGRGGHYHLEGLPPGTTALRIEASHASGRASSDRALAPGESVVDLQVVPTGEIRGAITGRRVAADTLVVATRVSDPASQYLAEVHVLGAFRFERLPPGDYALSVRDDPAIPAVRACVADGIRTRVVLARPGATPPSR